MKKHVQWIILASLMLMPAIAFSQFTVSAELRPRFEMDNGAIRPMPDTLNTAYYVTQRTRLKFDFAREKYQMRLSIQDVRFWGDGDIYSSTGLFASSAGLDIQEAWFRLKLCEYSRLTIGRQVLKIDDQRLIAGRNWNQFGMAYDALAYTYDRNDWALNTAFSYNTNIELTNGKLIRDDELFNVKNLMKTFNFIHLKRRFNKNFSASVMAIAAGYRHSEYASVIYIMGTYGLWAKFDNGKFDLRGEAYFQNGKAQSGKEVMAYMASLHPGLKIGKVRIGVGGDYLSGDNAENTDYGEKERTFNQMYGAVHKYYGYMNYYSYMKSSTANGGLIDLYPNLKVPFAKKHAFTLYYHKFYLANPVMIGAELVDNTDLGSEIDLMYTGKLMKDLVVQAGVSYYLTTESLEKVKKVNRTDLRSPYWAWVMITFTPELFSTK